MEPGSAKELATSPPMQSWPQDPGAAVEVLGRSEGEAPLSNKLLGMMIYNMFFYIILYYIILY